MHFIIEASASLRRDIFQKGSDHQVLTKFSRIDMADSAKLEMNAYLEGARLTRFQTDIHCHGSSATIDFNAAYQLKERRHLDLVTPMVFTQEGVSAAHELRGIVFDQSQASFAGKFTVEQAAQKTEAKMRHDALLLSEKAKIFAKPELEIYADNVACAHGNTIGKLDESIIFYCRQRGMDRAAAERLMTSAFLSSHLPEDFLFDLPAITG